MECGGAVIVESLLTGKTRLFGVEKLFLEEDDRGK